MSDFDTDYTDEPVCPHCGHIQRDSWEWEFDDNGCRDHECGKCCTVFVVRQHVSVEYSTSPKSNKESKP